MNGLLRRIGNLEAEAGVGEGDCLLWLPGAPRPEAGPDDFILKVVAASSVERAEE